jgi:hypothetical protein
MRFNRAADVSIRQCLRKWLTCLRRDHVWGDWFWSYYLIRERRICSRCGLIQDRWWPDGAKET